MKSLYFRIWLTVVAAVALFGLVSGWLLQHHLQQERQRVESALAERMAGWGELIQNSLPAADAPVADQARALLEWGNRLRVPLALGQANGERIAATPGFERLESEGHRRAVEIKLDDGRKLWMIRPPLRFVREGLPPAEHGLPSEIPRHLPPEPSKLSAGPPAFPSDGGGPGREFQGPPPLGLPAGVGLVVLLVLLFVAVAAGAFPVVRRLTRRLENLKQGVEAFGAGALGQRVDAQGHDEVAAVAASFNQAAERIQSLVVANQSLLANASHELRSPLARLKMAVAMLGDGPGGMQASLKREIDANIGELDALVEEVLLSSRLEAGAKVELDEPVDLLGLMAEEAARVGADAEGEALQVRGSDRLLRRAVRNLLENARRYGGDEILAHVRLAESADIELRVCDRGPGVPEAELQRIFEPFYRLAGHAEREGGVGLGLALVSQIARRHGGSVRCEAREGGGSCFVITLPAERRWAPQAG